MPYENIPNQVKNFDPKKLKNIQSAGYKLVGYVEKDAGKNTFTITDFDESSKDYILSTPSGNKQYYPFFAGLDIDVDRVDFWGPTGNLLIQITWDYATKTVKYLVSATNNQINIWRKEVK